MERIKFKTVTGIMICLLLLSINQKSVIACLPDPPECYTDYECNGALLECMSCVFGECVSDNSKCTGDCDECFGGLCVETSPDPCPGCQTCDGTNCQDDNSKCTGLCEMCSGGACVTDPAICTGECETCEGDICVDDDTKCTGECKVCNSGTCEDDDTLCPGDCDECSGGSCVPTSPDPCPGCKSCDGTNCQDDNTKCTICQTCSNGTCVPKTNTCDNCNNHGASCAKTPGTYCVGDAITAGTITAPADNSNVDSGDTIELTATAGSDSDCYYYTSADGCFTCSDSEDDTIDDDISWSAVFEGTTDPAGSFPSGDWGESAQWEAPKVCEDRNVVITATWNDPGSMYPYDSSVSHAHTVNIVADTSPGNWTKLYAGFNCPATNCNSINGDPKEVPDECNNKVSISCGPQCYYIYFYNSSNAGSCIWHNGLNAWQYRKTSGSGKKRFHSTRHATQHNCNNNPQTCGEGCAGYYCWKITYWDCLNDQIDGSPEWRKSTTDPTEDELFTSGTSHTCAGP